MMMMMIMRADIQSPPRWRTTIPGAVHLCCWCPWSTGAAFCRNQSAGCAVPSVRLTTIGGRAFPVAAAQIWNSTATHRLGSHVAVLQASLENVLTTTVFLPVAL